MDLLEVVHLGPDRLLPVLIIGLEVGAIAVFVGVFQLVERCILGVSQLAVTRQEMLVDRVLNGHGGNLPLPDMGPSPDPAALAGLLAEEARLRVFAAVVLGAATVEEVQEATGLERRETVAALERLGGGGVIGRDEHGGMRATAQPFKDAARAAAEARPEEEVAHPSGAAEATATMRTFVRDGKLTQIPMNRTKRLHVLDFLSTLFEPGRTYHEPLVNKMLSQWHQDTAALRRYLVDEGFLERRDGFYWRAGGTFLDVD